MDEFFELDLNGESLTLEALFHFLEATSWKVCVAPSVLTEVEAARVQLEKCVAQGRPVYGLTRGLGPSKDEILTRDDVDFQRRVLLSHATGLGKPFCDEIAKLALLIRANCSCRANFGVRPTLIERSLDVLNAGVVPEMPIEGSLGSGDLQAMAALGLVLIGDPHGRAKYNGESGPAPEILRRSGVPPQFHLAAGEALAIISGSTILSAGTVYALYRIRKLIALIDGAFALTFEAIRGEVGALDERIHESRRIQGQITAARAMRTLLEDSQWTTDEGRRRMGEELPRIQDAVSIRSSPHIHGALRETFAFVCQRMQLEINASTMNPLVFGNPNRPEEFDVLGGGNYDGSFIAHLVDYLNIALTNAVSLCQSRAARLVSRRASYGLPENLVGGQPGLNCGLAEVQSLQVSMLGHMRQLAQPASIYSLPVKDMHEDHNVMGNSSLCDLLNNLDFAEGIIAVEYMLAAQGIDLILEQMNGLRRGTGTAAIHALIRKHVAPVLEDRFVKDDLEQVTQLLRSDQMLRTVQQFTKVA